jgi:hypothetical protein
MTTLDRHAPYRSHGRGQVRFSNDRTRTVVGVYGPLVICLYLLATTRWGSYIIPGPPYIADLAIAVVIIDRLFALPIGTSVIRRHGFGTTVVPVTLAVLASVALLIGRISPEAIRDAAPFIYGSVVLLTPPLGGMESGRASRLITGFLFFHLAWTTCAVLIPAAESQITTLGNPEVHLLSTRSDVDGLVNGVAGALGFYRLLQGRQGFVMCVWGLLLVLIAHSRIAVGATAVDMVLVAIIAKAQDDTVSASAVLRGSLRSLRMQLGKRRRGRVIATLGVPLAIIVISGVVIAPTAVDRLGETVGITKSTGSQAKASAAGTTHARLTSWERLERWITSSDSRNMFGAGFGSNIMLKSEAGTALVHAVDPSLRAPHNYLLTVWAHLGLLGLGVALWLFAAGFRLAYLCTKHPVSDVDVFAALLLVGMPIIAVVGVVMEAPFGAIPYFWAMGHLGASLVTYRPRSDRRVSASG